MCLQLFSVVTLILPSSVKASLGFFSCLLSPSSILICCCFPIPFEQKKKRYSSWWRFLLISCWKSDLSVSLQLQRLLCLLPHCYCVYPKQSIISTTLEENTNRCWMFRTTKELYKLDVINNLPARWGYLFSKQLIVHKTESFFICFLFLKLMFTF